MSEIKSDRTTDSSPLTLTDFLKDEYTLPSHKKKYQNSSQFFDRRQKNHPSFTSTASAIEETVMQDLLLLKHCLFNNHDNCKDKFHSGLGVYVAFELEGGEGRWVNFGRWWSDCVCE